VVQALLKCATLQQKQGFVDSEKSTTLIAVAADKTWWILRRKNQSAAEAEAYDMNKDLQHPLADRGLWVSMIWNIEYIMR